MVIGVCGRGGTGQRFLSIAEQLSLKGIAFTMFDFRGRGASFYDGIPPLRVQAEDLQLVVDFALSKVESSTPLSLVCTSMGAFSTSLVCSKCKRIDKVIFVAPALYPNQSEDTPYQDMRIEELRTASDQELSDTPTLCAIRKFKGSVVLVELIRDEVIPSRVLRAYEDACSFAASCRSDKLDFSHAILGDASGRKLLAEYLEGVL